MANSCETCKHYEEEAYNEPCNSCRFRDYDVPTKWESPFNKQKTNGDRIRTMSDEELANTLWDIGLDIWNCNEYNGHNVTMLPECEKCDGNCVLAILKWLKQPAEEE